MNSRIRNFTWGIATQYLFQIVLIVLQVVIAPLLLKSNGPEALGGYAAIAQFTAYFTLLDFGFFSTLSRYLSQAFNSPEKDKATFRNYFAIGRWYLLAVSSVIFLLVFGLSFYIPFKIGLNPHLQRDGQLAMALLAVWYGSRFYLMMFGIALYATQNMRAVNICNTIGVVIRFICTWIFVRGGLAITGIVLANIVGDFTAALLQMIIFSKKYSYIRLTWKVTDKSGFKELFQFGFRTFLINIAARINSSSITFIASLLLGAAVASHYYSMYTPISVINTLIIVVMYNILPGMNEIFARREMENLRDTYARTLKFKLSILFAAFWGLLLYHRFIVTFWVGAGQYDGFFYTVTLGIYLIVFTVNNFNENILIVYGEVRWYSILQIVSTVVGLALTIEMGRLYQLKGIVLGNLIALTPPTLYTLYRLIGIIGAWRHLGKLLPNPAFVLSVSAIGGLLLYVYHQYDIKINLVQVAFVGILFMSLVLLLGLDKTQKENLSKIIQQARTAVRLT